MKVFESIIEKINTKSGALPDLDKIIPSRALLKKEPELSKADKRYSMAEMSFKNKDYRQAIIHASDAVKLNPKLIGPFLIMGESYTINERYIDALRILNRGIEFTGGFDIYGKIEAVYLKQGKKKEIVKMWNDFLKSSKRKDMGYKSLGEFYENIEEDYDKAIEFYSKTIEHNEVNFDVFEKLGDLYRMLGNEQKSIETYDKLLNSKHSKEFFRNSSHKARVLTKLGNIYFSQKKFIEAYKYFDMSLQAVPGDKTVYMRLGDIAIYVEDYKSSLRFYRLAYQADKTDIEMIIKHAIACSESDKKDEALILFKTIQKYNPLITNIKELVESYEIKKEFDEIALKGLIEENTDLIIGYKYPHPFRFPESREELDEMRKKFVEERDNIKEDIVVKEEVNQKVDVEIKEEEKFISSREEMENALNMAKKTPIEKTVIDETSFGEIDLIEDIAEIVELKETEEIGFSSETKVEPNIEKKIKKPVVEEIKIEASSEEIAREQKPAKEEDTMNIEVLNNTIILLENYVKESQELSRRIMQIKNIISTGELPEDNLKKNMINMGIENIKSSIRNNEDRTKTIKETLSKI
ncbi:MAG: hypothetical protein M0R46_07720 [Candidatus Muirbacterium halophilum]|nr:hypothetical protein [Candidatus Muirbacterium halophilum]MCK9475789.1 hypothetical protein [Candidatus Muirbacterium halophilum]